MGRKLDHTEQAVQKALSAYRTLPNNTRSLSVFLVLLNESYDAISPKGIPTPDWDFRDAHTILARARRCAALYDGRKPKGRPRSDFDHDYARKLLTQGFTERDAAKELGIPHTTLHEYFKEWRRELFVQ